MQRQGDLRILSHALFLCCRSYRVDIIRDVARDEPTGDENLKVLQRSSRKNKKNVNPTGHKVVVTSEHEFVVIGVNANDRPGLLLDISKGLLRLNLSLRHTEAKVVGVRSISIWRCELIDSELPDLEEIWSVLNVREIEYDNIVPLQNSMMSCFVRSQTFLFDLFRLCWKVILAVKLSRREDCVSFVLSLPKHQT